MASFCTCTVNDENWTYLFVTPNFSLFHIKPQLFKKLYRGHYLTSFYEIITHKHKLF